MPDWVRTVLIWSPLGIFGLISWSIWLFRRTMSHRAKPLRNNYTTTTSLVVPVYREDPEVLPCSAWTPGWPPSRTRSSW